MTIEEQRERLWNKAGELGRQLTAMSGGGPMGMTPDHVKSSPAWQAAKAVYDRAHAELRAFNTKHKPRRRVD